MLKIIKNPDEKVVAEIKTALKKTNGNCPCVLPSAWNDDTKCPCKNFREQDVEGKCHCGLFIKTEVNNNA